METDAPPRGPVPPVFFLLALLGAIAAHKLVPVMQLIHAPWNYIGVIGIAAGLAIAVVSAGAFARAGTPIVPFTESTSLVKHGCYRFTRNPMYLGMVLVLLGVDVLLGSLAPFIFLPLFAFIIHNRFIIHEEAMLEARFGDDYRKFKSQVRRWL
ncbi:MAG: isoprenylcysteine carboxylmethyltransferase family protein [Woeseia sp.]|nr:isoprenylcysteine carboxylmethyltransferase family protein [Woeseia sp.]MBT8098048.1 isoprenylcysteine carboxylmethyltransferase family protein [Woeseia sp.]NNE60077.1 isoprenylcysteine carboxylmethyltransferase family protein [Woeseia sp.]NNL54764.1 isoprenylcysteine carboxylmethyltransferase family protein [Woeseia sp.]